MILAKKFGRTIQGDEITLYSIKNANGMQADVMNFGAILVNLLVPDNKGVIADVVLGYDRVKDYFSNLSFFGATVGPVANRTDKGCFEIDGTIYNLVINDNDNNLHSDIKRGLHKAVWTAEVKEAENTVTFSIDCKDGALGFPGNRTFKVSYKVTEDNALEIHYEGTTDKATLMNLTNHTYFNLKGENSGKTIEDAKVWLKASRFTQIRTGAIPTGVLAEVAGTPLDFTTMKPICQDIGADNAQLALVKGYDHNFVIDEYEAGKVQKIAIVQDDEAGRTMEVYTDLPGVQLYTGNNMDPELGKNDAYYPVRGGLCLETQYFPNSANQEGFEKPVVTPDKPFASTTIYKFV